MTTAVECLCVYDGKADQSCHHCKGTGKDSIKFYPFEANLANGNGIALLEMLGIEADYCGSVDPQKVIDGVAFVRSLKSAGCDPLETETTEERGEKGCHVIHCGRTEEQVDSYLDRMYEIAMEAARRKVNVVWG